MNCTGKKFTGIVYYRGPFLKSIFLAATFLIMYNQNHEVNDFATNEEDVVNYITEDSLNRGIVNVHVYYNI